MVAVVGVPRAAAEPVSRPEDPVVVTGRTLTPLFGVAPDRVAAFRREAGAWVPIPVQVDERAVVDFGSEPPANGLPGSTGTVYGTSDHRRDRPAVHRPGHLGRSRPESGRGPQRRGRPDGPRRRRAGARRRPAGHVDAATGVELSITDPLEPGAQSWVYLFAHDGTLDPSAGQHLVDYDFSLASGDYKATYLRADGPNPEDSTITTAAYAHHFSDRWVDDELHITAGAPPGSTSSIGTATSSPPSSAGAARTRSPTTRAPSSSTGWAGPGHPLVRRRQQRPAHPAHPPLLRGPPRDHE